MLSETDKQLLTALIDGEVSSRQQKMALRLIKKSPEARNLYQQLLEDAQRLRDMPRVHLPHEFPLQIMREVSHLETPAAAASTTAAGAAAPFPPWLGLALAASVLVAVTLGSFFFARTNLFHKDQVVVQLPKKDKLPNAKPKPRLSFSVAQLGEEKSRDKIAKELNKESAFRLEMQCKNGHKAVKRLAKLLKGNGIDVVIEKNADKSLKEKKGRTYIVYMENVLPYDVSTLLYDLGKGEVQMPSSVTQVALFDMSDEQRGEVAGLLGVSADKLKPPEASNKGKKKIDLLETIPAPARKKNSTGAEKSAPAGSKHLAVVLLSSADPSASPSSSEEVQRFLATRGRPRPGTLQLVMVLHETAV